MSEVGRPEFHGDFELDGEMALARGAILSGEYSHAAQHAAVCLAMDPTSPDVGQLLTELHTRLGERAPDVINRGSEANYSSGEVALRAWMPRANQRTDEASTLLLQVIAADPERPWAQLLRAWLDEDPSLQLAGGAVQACCGALIEPVLHREPSEIEARNLFDMTKIVERALVQHPDLGELRSIASGVARRAGRKVDAVRWAKEGDRLAPSMIGACMRGYALRAYGDEVGAAAAFIDASQRAPEDPTPRVDAADTYARLGEWESASTWASSAWQLDPELPTAAARACYAAWKATGDAEHVVRLIDWVLVRCPDPEDPDALAALGDAAVIAGKALADLPWTAFIPVPANAAVDIARQVKASGPRPAIAGRRASLSINSSLPEAPSAVLALEHVIEGPAEVSTAEIPDPDPRVPRRKVRIHSWQLKRGRLVPGVKPPSASALASMHVTATWLYTVAHVRRDADRVVDTNSLSINDLVALATHPQPGPSPVDEAEWIRRWQVVCCFALARLGDFAVLTDLADGPEDWLCDAALAGLAELARLQPQQQPAVVKFAERHLVESARRLRTLDLAHFGSECDVILTIPDCPPDLAAAARQLKTSWAAERTNG